MMELDGVFMDLYGTLTAGDRSAVEATCDAVVRETGVGITGSELSIIWGNCFLTAIESCNGDGFLTLFELEAKTLTETMAGLGAEVDPIPYAEMLKTYWRNPPLHEDVKAFLDGFQLPICIVSNADHSDAEAALAKHGIGVAELITSEQVRIYKPDPGVFEAALARTGWRRDRVMHVGDSLHSDVGGASAAGIRTVWINRAHRIHDIGTHEPDHEIDDLHGLAALVLDRG